MFRQLGSTWEVEPYMSASRVTIRYEVKLALLGKAFSPVIRRTFARQCNAMLDNWQEEIESRFDTRGQRLG
ncbi:MAG TPA: hypothetical protein VMS60_11320 [Solirubrobacterales bacterium]|nr:hypothetical protein [Solirubrobacterales bacterium]